MEAWHSRLRTTRALVITSQLSPPDLPRGHAYTLKPPHPTGGPRSLLRLPIASCGGTGILTSFPSTTRFRLVLGADSPCADERCAGNLGLTATELFTLFIATHVSIRTSDTSSRPYDPPSQAYGTLSYQCTHSLQLTPLVSWISRRAHPNRSLDLEIKPASQRSHLACLPPSFMKGRLDVRCCFGVGRAVRALNFANNAKLASPKRATK